MTKRKLIYRPAFDWLWLIAAIIVLALCPDKRAPDDVYESYDQ